MKSQTKIINLPIVIGIKNGLFLGYSESQVKMLTKSKIKLIQSLSLKKNRLEEDLFVAEGTKLVTNLVRSKLDLYELYCIEEVIPLLDNIHPDLITILKKSEMERISALKSIPDLIALFKIPRYTLNWEEIKTELNLCLDSIQDPGNLGTIVRVADWFGIKNIVCSEECADIFNPKTIQATMGAIARVKIHYMPIMNFLSETITLHIPVYGTFLDGKNIYKTTLTSKGIVVMGNEGQGISKEIEKFITHKIRIPPFPKDHSGSESLNVATATAIVCAEFRRRAMPA